MAASTFVKTIKFNKQGGKVSANIFIGQAQFGQYTLKLYDENGKNPNDFGEGNNIDNLPDTFDIPISPNNLEPRFLGWVITIAAPDEGPGQLYFARITVIQDGKSLEDGPFAYSGPLEDTKILLGIAKFVA